MMQKNIINYPNIQINIINIFAVEVLSAGLNVIKENSMTNLIQPKQPKYNV